MAEENIQGAAEKISGLLNPKQDNQVPETKAEPSESIPEKQEVQESQSESKETPEQESENTETTEETPTELETPELHRVKVSGQELEVSLDELKAGYSRDSDYRQKTHTLGMEKRDLETQKSSLRQTYDTRLNELNDLISTANQFVEQKQGGQDLAKLYQEDPTEAARVDRKINKRKQSIQQAQQKLREHQETQFQEILRNEQKKLHLKHPVLADPIKGNSVKSNIMGYLNSKGFTNDDVSRIYDSRYFDVIMDGMKANATKPNLVSKKVKPTTVVKSGVKSTKEDVNSQSRLKKINALKKSGNAKDATDLLMRYL